MGETNFQQALHSRDTCLYSIFSISFIKVLQNQSVLDCSNTKFSGYKKMFFFKVPWASWSTKLFMFNYGAIIDDVQA